MTSQLLALRLIFALNALGLAMWFPRIPDVKAALGLDVLTLAFCLFGLPAGTMVGFAIVGAITRRLGLRDACLWGGSLFLLSFIGPALAPNALLLGLALFASGLTIAVIEVAMNAKASLMEQVSGRRLMTGCHAFWSFGSVTGALIGGVFAQAEVSFLAQQLAIQPLLALATVVFALRLDPDAAPTSSGEAGYARPSAALLLLCLVPITALMTEGAMMEWSALLLRTHVGADPFATAATYAVFATGMGLMRLLGDRLAERAGPRPVIAVSGAVMGAAMLGFALSPSVWLSLPLAALVGLGCANIYPLSMSMAGAVPGRRPEQNVATMALIAFTAFLIGPPLIGTLASLIGLPGALALLGPLGLVPALLLASRRF
jgi:MFS family permease